MFATIAYIYLFCIRKWVETDVQEFFSDQYSSHSYLSEIALMVFAVGRFSCDSDFFSELLYYRDRLIFIHRINEISYTDLLLDDIYINANAEWTINGVTVAGYNSGRGRSTSFSHCCAISVDEDESIIIADYGNHRIVEWKFGATKGQVIAGGNGPGNKLNQLNQPADVLLEKERNSLLICDRSNRRVVRWPRHNGTQLSMMIENIHCTALALDGRGFLYVADDHNHEVRCYKLQGEFFRSAYTIVAGGNGQGSADNQLDMPSNIFVNHQQTLYVSDKKNNRVMKWEKGANHGTLAAGGLEITDPAKQLHHPRGLFVGAKGFAYVVDCRKQRVMRWDSKRNGTILARGNGEGGQANQLKNPVGLAIDRQNNLYVVDCYNHRIQRFSFKGKSCLTSIHEQLLNNKTNFIRMCFLLLFT